MRVGKWIMLVTLVASPAVAQPAAPNRCFSINEFNNWRAADARTVYVRAAVNHFYRLDMANQCPALLQPNARLVSTFRGTSLICSGLDWDLRVGNGFSPATPCIIKTMTPLTPQDVAALPPKFKP